jgi:hypothetical protein
MKKKPNVNEWIVWDWGDTSYAKVCVFVFTITIINETALFGLAVMVLNFLSAHNNNTYTALTLVLLCKKKIVSYFNILNLFPIW